MFLFLLSLLERVEICYQSWKLNHRPQVYQPPQPPRDIEGAAGPLLSNIRPIQRVYNFYAPRDDELQQ